MPEKIPTTSRLPFLVVTIVLSAATICAVALRLSEPLPISPWEPAIAMEGMRLNAGLPLYDTGHATHIYGPLLSIVLAGIFRVVGLNLLAARILFSVFAFGLAILLSVILCRGNARVHWFFVFLLFLGINFRTNLILFSAQPDCAAAFFAVIGLYLWITRRESWPRFICSIAFFLCALFFKQTSAAFALIPIAHAFLWRRKFSEIAGSLIPLLSILLTLAAIRFFWPQMFWAMVTVPASLKVYYERSWGIAMYLLATFPIFLIALLVAFRSPSRTDERERWVWSAVVVLVPVAIWTICKSGAGYSSLLFGYLAMTALFVVKFEPLSEWAASLPGWRSFWASTAIAVAILCSFFIQFDRAMSLLVTRYGDEKYERVVALARGRERGVISPQDPTIAFRANGYLGRSLFFELDANAVNGNWPSELPVSMQQELAQANFVVQVNGYVPVPALERALMGNKFHPLAIAELDGSAYTLWAKGD